MCLAEEDENGKVWHISRDDRNIDNKRKKKRSSRTNAKCVDDCCN